MTAIALESIDIKPLMDRINHLIYIFGGVVYAFDMEWKIRIFVVEVLNFCMVSNTLNTDELKANSSFKYHAYEEHGGLKIDGEKAIEQFSQRV